MAPEVRFGGYIWPIKIETIIIIQWRQKALLLLLSNTYRGIRFSFIPFWSWDGGTSLKGESEWWGLSILCHFICNQCKTMVTQPYCSQKKAYGETHLNVRIRNLSTGISQQYICKTMLLLVGNLYYPTWENRSKINTRKR